MNKRGMLMLVVVVWLGGCGTTGRSYVASEMAETLEIEILPNASKMFTYRLRWPEESVPNHIRVARGGNNPERNFTHGGVNVGRNTHERLFENAAYVVDRSGYCRNGFFELDRSISRYHLWVRGECKDSATTADQEKFGSQKTLTSKQWRRSS